MRRYFVRLDDVDLFLIRFGLYLPDIVLHLPDLHLYLHDLCLYLLNLGLHFPNLVLQVFFNSFQVPSHSLAAFKGLLRLDWARQISMVV